MPRPQNRSIELIGVARSPEKAVSSAHAHMARVRVRRDSGTKRWVGSAFFGPGDFQGGGLHAVAHARRVVVGVAVAAHQDHVHQPHEEMDLRG